MKRLQISFIILFSLSLLVPSILHFSGWKEKTISVENKKMASLPVFRMASLDPFPEQYESYFNDHFPGRNSLIFGYTYFSARYLLKSPKPDVVLIGKEGWLYLTNNEQSVYTGSLSFSEAELKKSANEIEYRRMKCLELGSEYRIVIIPSKYTIYPEYLPPGISKCHTVNAVDQLLTYLKTHSAVHVLDLRPELQACKSYGPLYSKGDNHWNGLGVLCAYRALVKWLAKDYVIPAPLSFRDFSIRDTIMYGGNITRMIGMADIWKDHYSKVSPLRQLPEKNVASRGYPCPKDFAYCSEYEIQRKNTDTTLPGLFVIRDSFTNPLFRDLLASHFGHTTYIWDKWEHKLNFDLVKKEKPKVVLCMVIESMVDCFENYTDGPVVTEKDK
jgi:alginate O-acetyltransferase complex protein AlgJ